MEVACRLGAGSRRRTSRARERPAPRSRLNDATAASYQSVANMRPAAPKREMAVCSRSDTTSSAVGPSPKGEELAGLRGGRPSPNRHPPSCRAHRARSARAETQRRKALEFRSPRNAVRRQRAARRDCVHWYRDDSEQLCSDPADSVHEGCSPNNCAFTKPPTLPRRCAKSAASSARCSSSIGCSTPRCAGVPTLG